MKLTNAQRRLLWSIWQDSLRSGRLDARGFAYRLATEFNGTEIRTLRAMEPTGLVEVRELVSDRGPFRAVCLTDAGLAVAMTVPNPNA